MKTWFVLLVVGLLCTWCHICYAESTAAPLQLDASLSIRLAAPAVYVVTHAYPWPSNSLVLVMANRDVVLVDTPYTPAATEVLLGWIEKTFGKRHLTAIDTHYHIDRLGGNAALLARGIPVYGSDHTVRLLDERWAKTQQIMAEWITDPVMKEYHRTANYAKPDHVFKESKGLTLKFGREKITVCFPGAGHTPDNLVVYDHAKKVLFGGCVIVSAPKLGNITEADLPSWRKAIESLYRFNAAIVVPGHGGEDSGYSSALLKNTQDVLDAALRAQQKPA